MASITKLPDRKSKPWQVRIRRKGQTFVEYFRTKKDADAFAAKVEADFDRWAQVLGGELRRHTLGELIGRYLTIWTGKDPTVTARLGWWKDRFDERARRLASCDQSRAWPDLGLFVRLALATGARRRELLGLEWRDVDLKGGSIILLRDTKNGDDRRVPLLGDVRALLLERAKVRKLDDPRVFPSAKVHTLPPLDKAWTAAKLEAKVENLRVHDLRHSCGSYLAKAGASAFQIAAILGHRSGPGLTARYVHLVAEDSRGLMESALSGVMGEDKG